MKSTQSKISKKWVSTREIADYLDVSEKTLQRWRNTGLLKLGIHWRRKFPTTNRYIVYHLDLTEKAIRTYGSLELVAVNNV